jgi:hypothetical protein
MKQTIRNMSDAVQRIAIEPNDWKYVGRSVTA